ncbi:hypothetical protein Pve01_06340 [Planomonospora venezuelensis]|nr:hypothetical protein Pve01_06340 [Planomonospora venezuelensis]
MRLGGAGPVRKGQGAGPVRGRRGEDGCCDEDGDHFWASRARRMIEASGSAERGDRRGAESGSGENLSPVDNSPYTSGETRA